MSKTKEMIQFFIDKADAGAGVDYDGMYGYQCADLTCMGVYKFFGARLLGNAIDLLRSAEAAGLQVVYGAQYPKAGWFFVKNFVAGDGVNYGHTGLVYEDSDGSTIKTIEQNIDGNWDYLDVGGPCRYYERSVDSIVGYIVPPEEDQTGWKYNDGQGRNDLPSYAMPGSALYMMELNADSVAQAKEKINQIMEGKNND